jgi:hypothetical protein
MAKQKVCVQCRKGFKPRPGLTKKQTVCSEQCLINKFDTLVRKTRAIARIYAGILGYRSMSEVRFASKLLKAEVDFKYEPDTFTYTYKPMKYTPDFKVEGRGKPIYLEFKGKLDIDTRKKMRAIKKCNPEVDIRFVFEKPNNLIRKRKTPTERSRYWQWAEKNGFLWYDASDISTVKSDLKGKHVRNGKKGVAQK